MDTKLDLFSTDIAVLNYLSVSQIVLGIALLGVSVSTMGVAVQVLRYRTWMDLPLFFYAVPMELLICLVTLFIGSFGVHTVRNQVRVKRQFEILTIATFANSVLILLPLSMDAIAVLLEVSLIDAMYGYSFAQVARSLTFMDIIVNLVLVGVLITNFQLVKITRFCALVLSGMPVTDVVHFSNEKSFTKEGAYPGSDPIEPLINV